MELPAVAHQTDGPVPGQNFSKAFEMEGNFFRSFCDQDPVSFCWHEAIIKIG
jgi:hypothetical protein